MMDKRDIFEALGNIDERYVESAALSLDGKKKYAPRSFRLLPIAACLAILALAVTSMLILMMNKPEKPSVGAPADTTQGTEKPTDPVPPTTELGTNAPVGDGFYPDVKYDTEFRVLSKVSYGDSNSWGSYDIVCLEYSNATADLKKAIGERNDQLKSELGVDILQINGESDSKMYNDVAKSVSLGKNAYDMVIIRTDYAAKLAQKGYIASIQDDLKYVDKEGSYYDQRAMELLSVAGKNYFFVSDVTVTNFDAAWVYYFNGSLVDEYGLDDPYKLLTDGDWTVDKFLEMAEKATSDNGDNKWTKDDNWGVAGHGFVPTSMFFGMGMHIARADEAGRMVLTVNDSRMNELVDKVAQLRPCWARYSEHGSGEPFGFASGDSHIELTGMYALGHTLFMGDLLAEYRNVSLGGANADFSVGILPTPKLNRQQDEYYTPVVSSVATVACVPITSCGKDLDKASHIIDLWAGISETTVVEAYAEQYIAPRYSGRSVPADVMDVVLRSVSYDLGYALAFGDITDELQKILYDGDVDFADMYKEKSSDAQSDIDEFMASFA